MPARELLRSGRQRPNAAISAPRGACRALHGGSLGAQACDSAWHDGLADWRLFGATSDGSYIPGRSLALTLPKLLWAGSSPVGPCDESLREIANELSRSTATARTKGAKVGAIKISSMTSAASTTPTTETDSVKTAAPPG